MTIPDYFRAESYDDSSVPVPVPPMSGTRNTENRPSKKVQYGDVAGLLSGGLPEPPAPEVLTRTDGTSIFYSGQVNGLFGEPESGKSWIAYAAVAEVLTLGGRAAILDLDHNGMQSVTVRLLDLGVPESILANLERFRYKEPEDKDDLMETVRDLVTWEPGVVVIDSIGELLPTLNLNSNSPDDFTLAHTHVLKKLAITGACVIIIDHVAKNPDSKAQGPTGTGAKTRAIGGVSIRVTIKDAFTPGKGGSCYLAIRKDRHGGLRAKSPTDSKEPLAGTFKLNPAGHDSPWTLWAPTDGERMPEAVPAQDLADIKALDPQPSNVRDLATRMGWGNNRATAALRVFRQQCSSVPETQGRGTGTGTEQTGHHSAVTELFPGNTEQDVN
ncbi:AAA family ATPase [Arthrobacter sp. TMN-50]